MSAMNDVIEFLKDYIWKNGFDKLSDDPFAVYRTMIKDSRYMHTHHAENQCQLRRFEKKFVFPCYFLTFFASNVYVGLAILYRVPIKKVENICVLCGGNKDNDKKMKFITKII